jgi:hypothetical protein
MPQMMVKHAVVVMRDGQRVTPEIGKAFDFTEAELKELEAAEPVPVRPVVNEGEEEARLTDPLRATGGRPRKAPKDESTLRDGKTERVGSVKTPGGGADEETL